MTKYDVMEEEEMLDDDSSLYVSAVHKEALLRTDRQIYKSSKSPSRSLPGKGKGPDDPHSRQKTGNGGAEVSIEGKLPHFDTGIVPVRRSPTSNLGDFLKKMQKY